MAVEVNEIYSNLNKLLNDICQFLADGSNYQKLSPYGRKQADELIGRSKIQLQEIAKVLDENGAYMDMERKPVKSCEEDVNDVYSSVDETTTQPVAVEIKSSPYLELPAKDMSLDIKYGTLIWKYKIILNFEKNRRIYAGVHEGWFLIYSSEKDLKPLQALHLKQYKPQNVVTKQNKNVLHDFELICTTGDCKGKTYYFVATTHKDMLQWTSRILRCYEELNTHTIVDEEEDETYVTIPFANSQNDEEENNLPSYTPEKIITTQKPPNLPARRLVKPKIALPPIPQKQSSSSESSIYDPVEDLKSATSHENSFSDDNEDNEYEEFVSPDNNPRLNSANKQINPSVTEAKNLKIENNRHDLVAHRLVKPNIPPMVPKKEIFSEPFNYNLVKGQKPPFIREKNTSSKDDEESDEYQEFVSPENNSILNGANKKVNPSVAEAKNLKTEKNRHDLVIKRPVKPKIPLPVIPKTESSSESLIYDAIQDPKEQSDNSFSDEEEDAEYQEFVSPENKPQSYETKEKKQEAEKEEKPTMALGSVLERIANLEKPKPLVIPKILAQKSRPFPGLKK